MQQEFHGEYQTLVGFARAALMETRRLQRLLRDSGVEDTVLSQIEGGAVQENNKSESEDGNESAAHGVRATD